MKGRTNQILLSIMTSDVPVDINRLCSDYTIGRRMLRMEISLINDELFLHNLPLVTITRGKGYALRLTAAEQQKVQELILDEESEADYFTREERLLDLILSVAFSDKAIFLIKKEEYRVSKSTLDEDVRRVRSMLATYDLQLVSQVKTGLEIVGGEKNIQLMLFHLISRSFNSYKTSLARVQPNRHFQIISRYLPKALWEKLDGIYNHHISHHDDMYRRNFLIYSLIWILRQKLGYRVFGTNSTIKNEAIAAYLKEIKEDFRLNLSRYETSDISHMLDSLSRRDLTSTFEWGQAQILTFRLTKHIEQALHVNFSEQLVDFQSELFVHIAALLKRLTNDVQFLNPLTDKIKASYPDMFAIIHRFSPEVDKMTGKTISDDEIALLVIYFITLQTEINEEQYYYYKAVVLCNHGTATGNLLVASLKKYFNVDVQTVLSSREVDALANMDIDLIFSTVKIEQSSKPVLLINPIIRDLERQQIRRFLSQHKALRRKRGDEAPHADTLFKDILQLFKKKGYHLPKDIYESLIEVFQNNKLNIRKENIQPMMESVLLDDYIAIDKEVGSWEEAIALSASPLLSAGIIEEAYITAMIKSVKEHGPYIVIGPHLALAHARPEDGANQLGLSVLKLKKPVTFNHELNDPVQLVFCLSAVDSFSHLTIMRELVHLIHDTDKVRRLCQTRTVDDFKRLLCH